MKCLPRDSCSCAMCPQRRAIGSAMRICRSMASGCVCQLRCDMGPKGVHTGAMMATSTNTRRK
eukprot:2974137-Alexandrium_andersonii.AAC.1